jgi:hypothetical protein
MYGASIFLAIGYNIEVMKNRRSDQRSLTQRQLDYLDSRLDEAMPLTHTDPLPEDLLEDAEPSFDDLGY